MEAFWQLLMDISARHITPHGLYIPGDPYKFFLWNELLVIMLSFTAVILWLRNRGLRRLIERLRNREASYSNGIDRTVENEGPGCMDEETALKILLDSFEWFNCMKIRYVDAGGVITERVIEPARIYMEAGRCYVEALCRLRGEMRAFRMDRFIDISPFDDEEISRALDYTGDDLYKLSQRDNYW